MGLNAESQALMKLVEESGAPPLHTVSPHEARARSAALLALTGEPHPVEVVRELVVPSLVDDHDIGARLYWPEVDPDGPLIVYYHGGGWVQGSLDHADRACRELCVASGMALLSVDYRLAPEAKYPLPFEDAWSALQFARRTNETLGGDGRIVLAGDSAGGNLAAAVALRNRDEGGPAILHQLLVYPVTDHDFGRASHLFASEGLLTTEAMQYFWAHYVDAPDQAREPYASPLRAESHGGLPSATVVVAENDPLRDEGVAYARALEAAGVDVELIPCHGAMHGFWTLLGALPSGRDVIRTCGARMRATASSTVQREPTTAGGTR